METIMPENKDLFRSFTEGARKIAEAVTESFSDGGVVRTVYEDGLSRTRRFAQLAKMTADLRREKEELDRVFLEIGYLCYEQTKDAPDGFFLPLFAQVQEIRETLRRKESEIDALRKELGTVPGSADREVESSITAFASAVGPSVQQKPSSEL